MYPEEPMPRLIDNEEFVSSVTLANRLRNADQERKLLRILVAVMCLAAWSGWIMWWVK